MEPEDRSSLVVEETDAQSLDGLVRLCRVSEAAAIRMAALGREFHPSCFDSGTRSGRGTQQALLHPAWISGLAAAGIERAYPGSFVSRLEIVYLRQVCGRRT